VICYHNRATPAPPCRTQLLSAKSHRNAVVAEFGPPIYDNVPKERVNRCESTRLPFLMFLAFGFATCIAAPQPTIAQGIDPFGPYGAPTLSPYLDLLRQDGGVLPNYQQFVRPQLRLRRALRSQQSAIERQRREIGQLRRSPPRTRPGFTTGVRAGFLQYGRFYPGLDPR